MLLRAAGYGSLGRGRFSKPRAPPPPAPSVGNRPPPARGGARPPRPANHGMESPSPRPGERLGLGIRPARAREYLGPMAAEWPAVPLYDEWRETCDTLHAHTQVLGKLSALLAPPEPQLQHAALL